MPLIRAIGRWIARRNEVTEPYVPNRPMNYGGDSGAAMGIWLVFVVLVLPFVAFLVLTGLVYEGVLRLDRGSWLEHAHEVDRGRCCGDCRRRSRGRPHRAIGVGQAHLEFG